MWPVLVVVTASKRHIFVGIVSGDIKAVFEYGALFSEMENINDDKNGTYINKMTTAGSPKRAMASAGNSHG